MITAQGDNKYFAKQNTQSEHIVETFRRWVATGNPPAVAVNPDTVRTDDVELVPAMSDSPRSYNVNNNK